MAVSDVLTIAKLSRWSINYYNDTANAVGKAAKDAREAGGGLGEYYTEHDARTPVWLCAGDTYRLCTRVYPAWAARYSMASLIAVACAFWIALSATSSALRERISETLLGAQNVRSKPCTPRVPNARPHSPFGATPPSSQRATTPVSASPPARWISVKPTSVAAVLIGEKDLVKLPGLVAIAYQHETSRAGDPHLHTHVIVPNRQARYDGQLVSIDGTSLYHEAKAAGVIYQATLRRDLPRALGVEWNAPDPATGMAEVAGITADTITAWSQRSTQLHRWAAGNLAVADARHLASEQLAAAQGDPTGQTRTAPVGRVSAAVARR